MIVLDASVLIAHLDVRDAHHERAVALLLGIADSPLGASPITLAEVLVGPARSGELAVAESALQRLLAVVPLGAGAPRRLAHLRSDAEVAMPDCWVLLAAEDAGGGLATFDDRLASAARARGITVHGDRAR